MTNTITKEAIFEIATRGETQDFLESYVLYSLEKNEDGEYKIDELIVALEDNEDSILESADSQVSVYYSDQAKWFSENWGLVDEYAEEFGVDAKNFSVMQLIAGAWCIENERIILEDVETLKDELEEMIAE